MSKPQIDSEGFQLVSQKHKSKNKRKQQPPQVEKIKEPSVPIDIEDTLRVILLAVEELKGSYFSEGVSKAVCNLLESRDIKEIVCYGLGKIGECRFARYQLALLLLLREVFTPDKVFVYDPIFSDSECEVLKRLGLDIITENTEGVYKISDQGVTLAYLPHCPRELTNNFLWSNWSENLENCIIIANSFTHIVDHQPIRVLVKDCPFLARIQPYITEIELENNFKYTDIFNHTSVHSFPKGKLEKLKSQFWIAGDKPVYEDCECECKSEFVTSSMLEKLTLN